MRLFEKSHYNGVSDNVGNHPNAFFNSSFQYHKEVEKNKKKKEAAAAALTTTAGVVATAEKQETKPDVEMK